MTTKQRVMFGIIMLLLGIIGVLSLLTMDITLPEEAAKILKDKFTPEQIKWVILINPAMMVMVAVLIGTFLHDKVKLSSPIIKSLVTKSSKYDIGSILKFGVLGGVLAGVLITISSAIFTPYLPTAMVELAENIDVTLANRFLYGGITEEIMLRFGLMTLVVWIVSKILTAESSIIYWIGIIISSIVFGLGHLPIVFQTVTDPSVLLIIYVIVGNSLGGFIFGWLYWKKGLESAMIAHIFAHIVMLSLSFI